MHRTPFILLIVAIAFLFGPGCGGASDAKGPADSPEALLEKFVRAVENLDAEAAASCLDLSTEHGKRIADLISAAFRALQSQTEFEDAVRARFGDAFARDLMALGFAGPAALIDRVRELRTNTRLRKEGELYKVEALDASGKVRPGFPATMARSPQGWFFGVAPYLPSDPNLCTNLVYILDAFRTRYVDGLAALKNAEHEEAFLAAMKPIDGQTAIAAREAMVVVEPFLARYR